MNICLIKFFSISVHAVKYAVYKALIELTNMAVNLLYKTLHFEDY